MVWKYNWIFNLNNSTIPNGNASTDGFFLAGNEGTNSNYILTTPSTETSEWQFSLATNTFSPSGGNYFGVILMASNEISGDIGAADFTGYFLKCGANGSSDKIELRRKTGLGDVLVGEFNVNVSNGLINGLNIKVTRSADGTFELFYNSGFTLDSSPTTSAGTLNDNNYNTSSYFGVYQAMTNNSRRIYFDNLMIRPQTSDIIWTDGAWSNETGPAIDDDAVIDSGFTIADTESLEAKNLTVTENGNVTIQDGGVLTLSGKLTNEAAASSFVIENGGNFIQNQDYTTDDNSGEITVQRNSNEIVRLDYTMWSSPVKGQELQAYSPETLPNRIYTYETNSGNESTNGAYVEVPSATADFTQGKGYLFRAPNNWEFSESSETGAPYTGSFVGMPSNGNISVSTYSGGYTSIGNPYPSNIDPETLMNQNSGIGSLYFWNNPDRIETEPGSGEYTYTGTKYITFAGGSFSDPAYNGTSISVGQGFIVSNSENTVNFDNTMRVGTNESFFKTNEIENNRFWIQLNDANGNKLNTMLVNYRIGATNGFDNQIDAEFFGYDGSAIFNTIEDKNYIIQGRALPFADDDVVPLGFKADEAGKFTVSISQFDGLFENQTIYLKDNKFGIIHNLTESMYEFESAAGEFKERFEIVYKENETMGIDELYNSAVSIYKHKENFVVETKDSPIQSIQVFDLQGRLMLSNKQMNTMHYEFKIASKGVFVIHVTTGNGEIATKKIINQ